MSDLRKKRWLVLSVSITLLLIAQVIWWAHTFLREVEENSKLKEQLTMTPTDSSAHSDALSQIQKDAFHKRLMFISESIFWVVLTSFGLYLLYRLFRLEQRSREIQKNFIEIVTHESKTPITALKLRLDALKETKAEDPTVMREVQLCLEEVRRLSSVFEKAMAFYRFERRAFSFELLPIADILEDLLRRMEPFFRAKGAQIETHLDKQLVVKADALALQTCVQNVLENSVLYNDKAQKLIELSAKRKGSLVVIQISDNGPGVDFSEREYIFEQFYRGKGARRIPGTGLGLYLARKIIEVHQGVLRLSQEQSREGAHFLLEMPAAL